MSVPQMPVGLPKEPPAAPSPSDMADADRFAAAVDSSIERVRDSAEKWRTGTALFVTLVTTALLLKGPESAHDLPIVWRVVLTALIAAGLTAVLLSLWSALQAAAGTPQITHLPDIKAKYGSVRAYEVTQAETGQPAEACAGVRHDRAPSAAGGRGRVAVGGAGRADPVGGRDPRGSGDLRRRRDSRRGPGVVAERRGAHEAGGHAAHRRGGSHHGCRVLTPSGTCTLPNRPPVALDRDPIPAIVLGMTGAAVVVLLPGDLRRE